MLDDMDEKTLTGQLGKCDEQIEKISAQLKKTDQDISKLRARGAKLQKQLADLKQQRSAIIGNRIIALGFNDEESIARLYELAKERQERHERPVVGEML